MSGRSSRKVGYETQGEVKTATAEFGAREIELALVRGRFHKIVPLCPPLKTPLPLDLNLNLDETDGDGGCYCRCLSYALIRSKQDSPKESQCTPTKERIARFIVQSKNTPLVVNGHGTKGTSNIAIEDPTGTVGSDTSRAIRDYLTTDKLKRTNTAPEIMYLDIIFVSEQEVR